MPTAPIPVEYREFLTRALMRPLPAGWAYTSSTAAGTFGARGAGGYVAIEGVVGSPSSLRVVARGAKQDDAVVSDPTSAVERLYGWVAHFAGVPEMTDQAALALVRHQLKRLPGPDRVVQGYTRHQDNTITVRVDGPVRVGARREGLLGLGRMPRGEGTTWFRVGRTATDAFLVSHGGSYQRQGELVPRAHPGERLNPTADGWTHYLDASDDDGENVEAFEEVTHANVKAQEKRALATLPRAVRQSGQAYRLTAPWDGWPSGSLMVVPDYGSGAYLHAVGGRVSPRANPCPCQMRKNPADGGWTHYLDVSDDDGEGIEHFEQLVTRSASEAERGALAQLPRSIRPGGQAYRLTRAWDGWAVGSIVYIPASGEGGYLHAPLARANPHLTVGEDPRGWYPNPRVSVTDRLSTRDYPGVFADFSGRGVSLVDDPWPGKACPEDEACPDTIEEVRLADEIRALLATREEFEGVREELVRRLESLPYVGPHKVKSRTKTPYSIINKLRRKRLTGKHGLTDIAGAMTIVADGRALADVVREVRGGALGRVVEHEDFYATPNDGYRAHHFVVDVKGRPVEVQVKTARQANIAGAMHTAYKTGALNATEAERVGRLAEDADNGSATAAAAVDHLLADPAALERALTRARSNHHLSPGARRHHAVLGLVEVRRALPSDEYDVQQVQGQRARKTVPGHTLE